MSFNGWWYVSPSLFEALYRSRRDAEQLSHLGLALSQVMTGIGELISIHDREP